jgi:hypothetical protein
MQVSIVQVTQNPAKIFDKNVLQNTFLFLNDHAMDQISLVIIA